MSLSLEKKKITASTKKEGEESNRAPEFFFSSLENRVEEERCRFAAFSLIPLFVALFFLFFYWVAYLSYPHSTGHSSVMSSLRVARSLLLVLVSLFLRELV